MEIKPQDSQPQKDNVAAGLGNLKARGNLKFGGNKEGTLESKMPSRTENPQETGLHQAIDIPVSKYGRAADRQKEQGNKPAVESPITDHSVFGGKPEISRRELGYKMKHDPDMWRASQSAGLNLGPTGRAEIVERIPKFYGDNISKSELRKSVGELSKRLNSGSTPQARPGLRKEIKFLKKIGGV